MSSLCPTLAKVARQHVDFDPSNIQHLEAFRMLCLGQPQTGSKSVLRQHPTLRFNVEYPFCDVRSMMFARVAQQHIQNTWRAHGISS